MFVVKRMRTRILIGGTIINSVLSELFPKNVGLVYGILIGIIVMITEQLSLKIGNWGRGFGGWIGNWAIGLGESMGDWAIGFAEIISGINLLRSIQVFGFAVMIVTGLAIIGIIINKYNIISISFLNCLISCV